MRSKVVSLVAVTVAMRLTGSERDLPEAVSASQLPDLALAFSDTD